MTLQSTRVEITSAAKMVIGPTSTIVNNTGASWWWPIQVSVTNLNNRLFVSPTSAASTATAFVSLALNTRRYAVTQQDQWWCFTSAASTAAICVIGGSV